ncbi:MAG: hypothetical protein FK731_05900 [Asgard group archaeon]|nr:hypothetical protein [Asgard group archaeon]
MQYQKKERWQDFIKSANECAQLMIKEKPDFIIHCGDFFHQYKPTPGALRFAIKILNKFKKANIPFLVIRGNHDASKAQAQRIGGTILKFLDELDYLVYVQDEQISINEDITFTGIGEYGQTIASKVEESLRNNPLDKSKFNILALHGYLQGQISDTIYDITGYQLASMGYNYIALGHYHKKWIEAENNIYCPGSTEQTSLNDWGEPDKDGFFRKSGYFSVKIAYDNEKKDWVLKVLRKEFDIRPKGRFIFNFDDTISIENTLKKANEFVEKNELKDAIIRYDFIGKVPLGKQSLFNFNNLPAIKNSEALHIIVNQQISNIISSKTKSGITSQEALRDLIETTYGFKKSATSKWLDLVFETVKIMGHKTISSEESNEVQSIYNLISEISTRLTKSEMARETRKAFGTNIKELSKNGKKTDKNTSLENVSEKVIENSNKTKQSALSEFIKGDE